MAVSSSVDVSLLSDPVSWLRMLSDEVGEMWICPTDKALTRRFLRRVEERRSSIAGPPPPPPCSLLLLLLVLVSAVGMQVVVIVVVTFFRVEVAWMPVNPPKGEEGRWEWD